MTTAVIGLGGNIGEPQAAMAAALDRLTRHPGIALEAVSALYRTPPWGNIDQPPFLNAAVRVQTALAARELLEACLTVERELGRERRERWGPRTIDLDILLFGDAEVDKPGLTIPHPRLAERAFALLPLADVAPDATIGGRPARDWLDAAGRDGIVRLAGPDWYPLP